ncbi:MAG TPA: twin-arginine translocase TatA/TatE family subunit [Candidatus Thermoplasmatota archaeon]|nr:twin-arginine translocase TatA/TatE family subunit [Candidatus Thermoplasmatota archaeon]
MALLAFMSTQEWLIVGVIVVLLFGAAKIPELARALGRAKGEFQKASKESESETAAPKAEAPKAEDEKTLKVARDLGIPTDGRPLDEIKADIRKKMA